MTLGVAALVTEASAALGPLPGAARCPPRSLGPRQPAHHANDDPPGALPKRPEKFQPAVDALDQIALSFKTPSSRPKTAHFTGTAAWNGV